MMIIDVLDDTATILETEGNRDIKNKTKQKTLFIGKDK